MSRAWRSARTGWLVTGNAKDAKSQLWELSSDGPASQPIALSGGGPVQVAAFSPDGRWLATGSDAGKEPGLRLWDLKKDDPAQGPIMLRGQTDGITALAFDREGRRLASGSRDLTVMLWDLKEEGAQRTPVVLEGHAARVTSLVFSADGHRLFSGDLNNSARLWTLALSDLLPLACRTAGRNLTREEWSRYLGDRRYDATCRDLPETP